MNNRAVLMYLLFTTMALSLVLMGCGQQQGTFKSRLNHSILIEGLPTNSQDGDLFQGPPKFPSSPFEESDVEKHEDNSRSIAQNPPPTQSESMADELSSPTEATAENTVPPHTSPIAKTPVLHGESGTVRPTVYYFPIIEETPKSCTDSSKRSLLDKNGDALAKVCPETYRACALQGTCMIVRGKNKKSFNVAGRDIVQRFMEMKEGECPYGYGVKNICLDPFYTIAADLSIYKPGDVIYMPSLREVDLPNGEKHSGYFVVRDTGNNIKGKGRFDFFTGFLNWRDVQNPFSKIGLASKNTKLEYFKVPEDIAQSILQSRAYPKT
ncbi:MAG: 3D domain-containing protein, partial [Pseudobdellovibrionaceae bacterium]